MTMVMPKLWSKSSNFVLQATKSHLKKYGHLLNWKENESILEFGFATGDNSIQSLGTILPKNYKEFVATGVSENMVEHAKKYCNIPKSSFFQLDIASKIPENLQGRFDHVFGFVVIHMVKNPREAFKNIYNMLKPGGTTFLTFFERIPCDDVFERLTRHPKWGKFGQEEMISTYFYDKNPQEEYKKDLEAAGFKNYIFKIEKGSYNFSSPDECYNICISVNSIIPKIPKEDLEEYIKDYLGEFEKSQLYSFTNENGKKNITVNYTFFVVIATKEKNKF